MANGGSRFLLPILFVIAGFLITVALTTRITAVTESSLAGVDLVIPIPGEVSTDVSSIIMLVIPLYFLEFLILGVPVAVLMLIVNRLYRVKSYTQSLVRVGSRFGASRMIRRAVVPALFALSFSGLVQQLFPGLFVRALQYSSGVADVPVLRMIEPLVWLIGALIAMAAAIPIFAPTWLLNDSGVVNRLKSGELEIRRCPDTEGVGKWYSHYVSGFAILSYPVTVASTFIIRIPTMMMNRGVVIPPDYIIESLLWILGLPLVTMAFILPIIIVNELLLSRISGVVRNLARRLGARSITLAAVEVAHSGEESESPTDF
ncbi:MAG: hypothetical protein ACXADO_09425 [Candidatus Thorarchaeota archaeon]|jgi:hypothetical protein